MAQSGARKKICIAITKSNFGGAQRYVYDIARLLSPQQYDVLVLHGGNGRLAQKLGDVQVRTVEIPGLGRDVSARSDIHAFLFLIRTLSREKPDVLHLNSSKMGLMGALAGRVCGVSRIIFTAHGWPFNEHRSTMTRAILRVLARITIALSHHTIAVSHAVARATDPQRHSKKISVIHNGVEAETYLPRDDARRALVPSHEEQEFWFGTIAELHPIKGISYALEAFRRHAEHHPQSRYVLIGDGEERERLVEYARKSGFDSRITFCGFRDNAASYLKAFDAFVLPSLSEALSYAILEAGAASLPVIATDVGGIPEIIGSDTGLLVPPANIEALAQAMERMENNTDYRRTIAQQLGNLVLTRFSLETMFEKTKALY